MVSHEQFFEHEQAIIQLPEPSVYYRTFFDRLRNEINIPDSVQRLHPFPDNMPLPLVKSAKEAVMVSWFYGDTWEKTVLDMFLYANSLTADEDIAGPNVNKLRIVFPFLDGRMDKRPAKPIPDSTEMAISTGQGQTVAAFAEVIAHVAHAHSIITLDLHSKDAQDKFTSRGVEVFNILPTPVLVEKVADLWNFKDRDNVDDIAIGTTDFGSLNRAVHFQSYVKRKYNIDIPIILMGKNRISDDTGVKSSVKQTVVYGDMRNKRILFFDDIYASVGSAEKAVTITDQAGAKEMIVFATHMVFSTGFYDSAKAILANPKVKAVLTTDALPVEDRRKGGVSIPYLENNPERRVEVLPVAQLVGQAVRTIIHSSSSEEARCLLADSICDLRDPLELANEVFGVSIPGKKYGGIYLENGVVYTFEQLHERNALMPGD